MQHETHVLYFGPDSTLQLEDGSEVELKAGGRYSGRVAEKLLEEMPENTRHCDSRGAITREE